MLQYTFEALYTPQLVQKRKKWHDGRCLYLGGTKKLVLVDDEGRVMAERFWSGDDVPEAGTTIQLDRYLVELDSLLRVAERAVPDAPPAPHARPVSRPAIRPSRTTLGRPLSDLLHDASMQIKPLGSGPIERRVKRVKADKFGGLSPALLGRMHEEEVRVKPEATPPRVKSEDSSAREERVKPEGRELALYEPRPETEPETKLPPPENTGFEQGHDDSELFVEDHFDTFVHDEAAVAPVGELASAPRDELSEGDQAEQDSDDLFSDTEVEVLQIADAPRARRSLFEDMPEEGPVEGPWTKEAYLLFSWHPPQAQVKEEAPM